MIAKFCIALLVVPTALAQATTLAATPPMVWNSWNQFAGRWTLTAAYTAVVPGHGVLFFKVSK